MAQNQLLLIQDVDNLGRSGDLVRVKPGFARNFLLPQKKALIADKGTVRLRAKLQQEREKLAFVDKQEAEGIAARITDMRLSIVVKVDQEGHMYGSVSQMDIVHLFEKEGIQLEKRNVILPNPIKKIGETTIQLKLKEGVPASFTLVVESDIPVPAVAKEAPVSDL